MYQISKRTKSFAKQTFSVSGALKRKSALNSKTSALITAQVETNRTLMEIKVSDSNEDEKVSAMKSISSILD